MAVTFEINTNLPDLRQGNEPYCLGNPLHPKERMKRSLENIGKKVVSAGMVVRGINTEEWNGIANPAGTNSMSGSIAVSCHGGEDIAGEDIAGEDSAGKVFRGCVVSTVTGLIKKALPLNTTTVSVSGHCADCPITKGILPGSVPTEVCSS